jgi:hypothetical protein
LWIQNLGVELSSSERKKPDPLSLCYLSHCFGAGVFLFQTPGELIRVLAPMGITVEESRALDSERFWFDGVERFALKRRSATQCLAFPNPKVETDAYLRLSPCDNDL